jgi:hypothetical protein
MLLDPAPQVLLHLVEHDLALGDPVAVRAGRRDAAAPTTSSSLRRRLVRAGRRRSALRPTDADRPCTAAADGRSAWT